MSSSIQYLQSCINLTIEVSILSQAQNTVCNCIWSSKYCLQLYFKLNTVCNSISISKQCLRFDIKLNKMTGVFYQAQFSGFNSISSSIQSLLFNIELDTFVSKFTSSSIQWKQFYIKPNTMTAILYQSQISFNSISSSVQCLLFNIEFDTVFSTLHQVQYSCCNPLSTVVAILYQVQYSGSNSVVVLIKCLQSSI